jgi:hypothetical protein
MDLGLTERARKFGILYSLKNGVVPRDGVVDLTVGRRPHIKRIRTALESLAEKSRVEIDLVEGNYGEGKSHMLELIRAEALSRNFGVAKVVANFDTLVFSRPALVHHGIGANLELPNFDNIGILPLIRNMSEVQEYRERVDTLYNKWLKEGWHNEACGFWPPGLQTMCQDPRAMEIVGSWLAGGKPYATTVRHAIYPRVPPRRLTMTKASIASDIAGLSRTLSGLGYSGLVLLIDEAENAFGPLNSTAQRRQSSILLHELSALKAPLYVVAAVTPYVEERLRSDSNWAQSDAHRAAAKFLLKRLSDDHILRIPELSTYDLKRLSETITALHGSAFEWNAIERVDLSAREAITSWVMSRTASIRSFVKLMVQLLDVCHQHEHVEIPSLLVA